LVVVRAANLITSTVAAILLETYASSASDGLPPITPDLQGVSAVACVKISKGGSVSGAFLVGSTGDPERDRHLLQWIKQLHWRPAEPDEELRDTWFPMPLAIGDGVKAPDGPKSCSPPPTVTPRPAT
jgi:TonB family protein